MESTKALAEALPFYVKSKVSFWVSTVAKRNSLNLKTVNWILIANDVLMKWVEFRRSVAYPPPRAHSLELLRAMNKSNPDAARSFQEALTCGKNLEC